IGKLREVSKRIPADVMCHVVDGRSESLESWRCHNQVASGAKGRANLLQHGQVLIEVLERIEKKRDVPSVPPLQIEQVDLVPSRRRRNMGGRKGECRQRGVGERDFAEVLGGV